MNKIIAAVFATIGCYICTEYYDLKLYIAIVLTALAVTLTRSK